MKKIIGSILLILVLIFHFSGSSLLFHVQRHRIRREIKTAIKHGVPRNKQTIIKFPRASEKLKELHWHNDHEFRFKGKMYDVLHEHKRKDSIYFYCIDDHQETTLFARLESLVKKRCNEGPAKDQRQQFSLAFSSFYILNAAGDSGLYSSISKLQKVSEFYFFHLKTWVPPSISPPPRFDY